MANIDDMDDLHEDLQNNDVDESRGPLTQELGLVDPDEDEDEDDGQFEDDVYNGDLGDQFEDDDEMDDDDESGSNDKPSLIETNIINDLLKEKGIIDPKAIKYENEDGEIEEFDFYTLPYEDQLQILKQTEQDSSNDLSEHENEVVTFLREQNATFDEVLDYVRRKAIEDHERENSGKAFTVDEYEDDELFLIDLKLNFDDLTEDELKLQLERELENEELFKKKIAKIRAQYVDLELKERTKAESDKLAKDEEEFETLSTSLIEAAVGLEDIGGLVLEDNDKNIILSTVLETDVNGKSAFDKKMTDPQMRFKAAWFLEKGDEAFDLIHDYYKKEIDKVRKSAYAKAKSETTDSTQTAKPGKLNATRADKSNNGRKFVSIDDLS